MHSILKMTPRILNTHNHDSFINLSMSFLLTAKTSCRYIRSSKLINSYRELFSLQNIVFHNHPAFTFFFSFSKLSLSEKFRKLGLPIIIIGIGVFSRETCPNSLSLSSFEIFCPKFANEFSGRWHFSESLSKVKRNPLPGSRSAKKYFYYRKINEIRHVDRGTKFSVMHVNIIDKK